MKQLNLAGKTALVTGGAGQLGRAICKGLAECGANVAICYHSQADYAARLKDELESSYGVKAAAIKADIADKASVAALKTAVNEALGVVDILVNCAVAQYQWETVLEQDIESYQGQFNTSVLQAVLMSQAFAPDMIRREYGRIIGINTECTMQMLPYQSAYVAGKRGMDGVYRVLAKEIGKHNITVNQVAPGWTISDSNRNPDPLAKNIRQDFPYVSTVPLARRGTDEDIANAVCFLASDLAGFISGVYLPVCGGNVMPCV